MRLQEKIPSITALPGRNEWRHPCISRFSRMVLKRLLILSMIGLGMVPVSRASDIIILTNNQKTSDAHVDSYSIINGKPTFQLRAIRNGIVDYYPAPLEASQITSIEFRQPGDTDVRPSGRPGAMVMTDGRRYEDVWVESCKREGEEVIFQVRQAGVPPGGEAHPVKGSYLEILALSTMNLPTAVPPTSTPVQPTPVNAPPPGEGGEGMMDPARFAALTGEGGPPVRVGGSSPPIIPTVAPAAPGSENPPQPTTEATPVAPPPEGGAVPPEAVAATPTPEKADVKSAFDTGDKGKKKKTSSSSSSWDDDSEDYPGRRGGGGIMSIGIFVFGFRVSLPSLLIGMVVAFFLGGTSLYFSARTEGTNDLKFSKAVGTAALLTIFPPIIFVLCVRFIPFFGLWAGFAGWIFSARAIVMGMLEVLEAKAAAILMWFYVFLILGVYFSGKLMPG